MSANMSETESMNKSKSFIWGGQSPFLKDLYGMGQGVMEGVMDGASGLDDLAAGFLPGMTNGFNNLAALGDASGQIAAQGGALKAGLQDMWTNDLMPSITGNQIAAGGLGSGRDAVARSQGAGEIMSAYTTGMGDITANANNQAMMANSMLGAMANDVGNVYGMGNRMRMDMLGQYAGILGGPTVLSKSKGTGSSSGWGFGFPGFGA